MKTDKTIKKIANVLIVDDDSSITETLSSILDSSFEVLTAKNSAECFTSISNEFVDIVFLDILLGGEDGFEILQKIKSRMPEIQIIMMSVLKKSDNIVRAIKLGAVDFLDKDFHPDDVLFKANKALKNKEFVRNIKAIETNKKISWDLNIVPIHNLSIFEIFSDYLLKFQKNNFLVVSGEQGTGKKTLAKAAHHHVGSNNPFINFPTYHFNSDKMVKGLFFNDLKDSSYEYALIELANKGILYIDGIEKTTQAFQKRIHSLLENGFVVKGGRIVSLDVKIVASTHKSLDELKESGDMIPELFCLCDNESICLPPLRERKDDIIVLSEHFLKLFSAQYGKNTTKLTNDVKDYLCNCIWSFNLLELKNLIESVVISASKTMTKEDFRIKHMLSIPYLLSLKDPEKIKLKDRMKKLERDIIVKVLREFDWNRKKTADFLSIPYNTFKAKLKNYKIKRAN